MESALEMHAAEGSIVPLFFFFLAECLKNGYYKQQNARSSSTCWLKLYMQCDNLLSSFYKKTSTLPAFRLII